MQKPVFVVGCGRSGTTLLRLMLDSHPDFAIPGESNFIRYSWANRRAYMSRGRFIPERLVEDIVADSNVLRWGIAPGEVRAHVRALGEPGFADVLAAPFQVYARMRGKPLWGDKTPIYVLSIPTLARLFPGGRFVHLIRDGRDVALSYLAIPMFEGTIWDASWRWRDWVTAGIRAGRDLGPTRYTELRYENLVARPEHELRSLCRFLDVRFDERMLTYYVDAQERLEAPTERVPFHTNASQPPRMLRDWRVEMSDDLLAVFESVAGKLLGELGYERALSRTALRLRTQAIARNTIHSLHVRGSKAKKAVVRIARCPAVLVNH